MLPGSHVINEIYDADADDNTLNITTGRVYLKNKVWNFDLKSQKWDVQDSGIEDEDIVGSAVAFDAEKQVGWYYGGFVRPSIFAGYHNGGITIVGSLGSTRGLQDLYRLDRGKETPVKVKTDSTFVGNVELGELVYIRGLGKAGILVLIGGDAGGDKTRLVSIRNRQQWHPRCYFD